MEVGNLKWPASEILGLGKVRRAHPCFSVLSFAFTPLFHSLLITNVWVSAWYIEGTLHFLKNK